MSPSGIAPRSDDHMWCMAKLPGVKKNGRVLQQETAADVELERGEGTNRISNEFQTKSSTLLQQGAAKVKHLLARRSSGSSTNRLRRHEHQEENHQSTAVRTKEENQHQHQHEEREGEGEAHGHGRRASASMRPWWTDILTNLGKHAPEATAAERKIWEEQGKDFLAHKIPETHLDSWKMYMKLGMSSVHFLRQN